MLQTAALNEGLAVGEARLTVGTKVGPFGPALKGAPLFVEYSHFPDLGQVVRTVWSRGEGSLRVRAGRRRFGPCLGAFVIGPEEWYSTGAVHCVISF